jgi:cytochrome c biogenesis protein
MGLISGIGSLVLPRSFFQTGLFQVLLLLLLLNITLCTINRFAGLIKSFSRGEQCRQKPIRQAALFILHAGVVLILIGGIINFFYGVKGQITLLKGETADLSQLGKSAITFHLKLEDFRIDYYANGSASQYYSDVSLLEGNEIIRKDTIYVNHPLKLKGTKIYLQKFNSMILVRGESDSGWKSERIVSEGESFHFPDSGKALEIVKYVPNYDPEYGENSKTLRPDHPRVLFYIHEDGQGRKLMVAALNQRIEVDPGVFFEFNGPQSNVTLIVKSDPGLPVVAFGGLMLVVGVCLSIKKEIHA